MNRMIAGFVLMLSVLFSGCYGTTHVNITRKHTDDKGNLVTVTVTDQSATTDGAARLLEATRQIERTKLDGEAEKRTSKTADLSVEKGQPTSVSTRGGSVTSGYTGYGMYDAYGLNDFGMYGPGAMSPGVSPEAVRAEQATRFGGMLPPLGTVVYDYPVMTGSGESGDEALATCPRDRAPATTAERAACTEMDTHELIRTRPRAKRK